MNLRQLPSHDAPGDLQGMENQSTAPVAVIRFKNDQTTRLHQRNLFIGATRSANSSFRPHVSSSRCSCSAAQTSKAPIGAKKTAISRLVDAVVNSTRYSVCKPTRPDPTRPDPTSASAIIFTQDPSCCATIPRSGEMPSKSLGTVFQAQLVEFFALKSMPSEQRVYKEHVRPTHKTWTTQAKVQLSKFL